MTVKDALINGLLETGMKAEGLRQQAIANNVANIQTNGYRRLDVKFETVLAKAIDEHKPLDSKDLEPSLFRPNDSPINEHGSDVSLDSEVGEMVKNGLRHKAYTLLLKKRYQMMDAAMRVQ